MLFCGAYKTKVFCMQSITPCESNKKKSTNRSFLQILPFNALSYFSKKKRETTIKQMEIAQESVNRSFQNKRPHTTGTIKLPELLALASIYALERMAICQNSANAVIEIPATAQMSNSVLLGTRSFKEQPNSATSKAKRTLKSMRLVLKTTFSFWVASEALTFLEENPFAALKNTDSAM